MNLYEEAVMEEFRLDPVERLEVTVLVDNYTDLFLLQGKGIMKRPVMPRGITPLAEHGLSLLIEVTTGQLQHRFLMDAALTSLALLNNLDAFCKGKPEIEGVVLSHGHLDHFGGLKGLVEKVPPGIKLILHPDAFFPRRLNIPGAGPQPEMPTLNEKILLETGVEIRKKTEPSTWFDDLVLVLGEVERITDFETGFLWAEIKTDNLWSVDPFNDDQGVAFLVKDKGLVVIGGCAHAGIINTVHYAQKITGINKVLAVLGGFHLTGPLFEPLIQPTIEEMKRIDPDYIIPFHCTGWKAMNAFAARMPERFYLTTVGTRYIFE
jgi:7,8-dihydropterin-6-yl-methyl-4-(beta-D-ribofuranosyl)aminobenzene 5'-phosphate synthase